MNHRRNHRTAVIIFAVALAFVVMLAFATTLYDVDTQVADSATPPGTVGLAKPHRPLDVAPGQAIPSLPQAPASSR
jgi:hypothetical protein